VLSVKRLLLDREPVEAGGMVLRSEVWVFNVDELGTAFNVVEAAGAVITEVTMSDIVTVSVNDLMTWDTVTIRVVVCSVVICAVEA
jgi:hypothetical protein